MTDWQPGDVALCVDDRGPYGVPGAANGLAVDVQYTVTAVTWGENGLGPDGSLRPQVTLSLLELKNPWDHDAGAFAASRFIKQPPLISEEERKTSRPFEKERCA